MNQNNKNRLAIALTLFSFAFLLPGIYLPMLSLKMQGQVKSSFGNVAVNILNKSSSILQTVNELFEQHQTFVACMIFFFSVLVPVCKGLLLLFAFLTKNLNLRYKLFNFVKSIGKWSMADVFVVGVFLAYLSTRNAPSHSSHNAKIMGFSVDIDIFLNLESSLGTGFYFFFSYCMLSLLALQLFSSSPAPDSK